MTAGARFHSSIRIRCHDDDWRHAPNAERSACCPATLHCCSYGESGVALLRPLAPGEPTWPELLEVVERRKQMEAAAAESARQVS
jgi:hypothetical protein